MSEQAVMGLGTSPPQAAVVSWWCLINQEGFHMLKSTLIAKCLHQCGMISDVPTGEAAVESIFGEYFPDHSYKKWNTQLADDVTSHFLSESRNAGTIHVDSFIKDLWSR